MICRICNNWYHAACVNISNAHPRHCRSHETWFCYLCLCDVLPFMHLPDYELLNLVGTNQKARFSFHRIENKFFYH